MGMERDWGVLLYWGAEGFWFGLCVGGRLVSSAGMRKGGKREIIIICGTVLIIATTLGPWVWHRADQDVGGCGCS